jgi:hypothetical protein
MDASKALGIFALLLGLMGSIANGFAARQQLSGTRLNLTKEADESAKKWSVRGWFLVGSAAVAGIIATWIG